MISLFFMGFALILVSVLDLNGVMLGVGVFLCLFVVFVKVLESDKPSLFKTKNFLSKYQTVTISAVVIVSVTLAWVVCDQWWDGAIATVLGLITLAVFIPEIPRIDISSD